MTKAHELLRQIRQVALPSTGDVSDQELLRRYVASGDVLALELLIWRHQRLVLGVCLRVLKDVHDAEDAFQATFLVLARKAHAIRNGQAVAAWLYEVAYRVALTALRRRRRQAGRVLPLSDTVADGLAAEPPSTPDERELLEVLDRAVNRLPVRHRAAVVLCYLEGKTHEEAARLLGCAAGTVASRLSRARGKLRAWLEGRGVTLSAAAVATVVAGQVGRVTAGRELVSATARAARSLRGAPAPGEVSPTALALSNQAIRAMTLARVRGPLVALAVAGLVALGLGGLAGGTPRTAAAPPGATAQLAAAKPGVAEGPATVQPQQLDPDRVKALVKQLGSVKFAERQAARQALLDMGPAVVPLLNRGVLDDDVEIKLRLAEIRYLLVGLVEDLEAFLRSQSPVYEDKSIEVPDAIRDLVARHQPRSGDYLLGLISNPQHRLHWPAVNLFVQTWDAQSVAQFEAYLQHQLRFRVGSRPRYPADVDAGIEMGFSFAFGLGSRPKGLAWQTQTTHYLDGKPNGKPYLWTYPSGATTGWIRTGPLPEGKHTGYFVVEFTVPHRGKQCQGKVRSHDFTFEVVAAATPDDLVAPEDAATDQLVRRALEVVECQKSAPPDPRWGGAPPVDDWAPQITWQTPDGKNRGLHVPVWRVHEALPVDLCFDVVFEDLGTGKTHAGAPLVLLKGKTCALGYLTPRDVHAFGAGRTGFVDVRVRLTPSRALALSVPAVTRYYAGSYSQKLRLKITAD
jgi:RNA polymerase sigma factor (sigma-70 family)